MVRIAEQQGGQIRGERTFVYAAYLYSFRALHDVGRGEDLASTEKYTRAMPPLWMHPLAAIRVDFHDSGSRGRL